MIGAIHTRQSGRAAMPCRELVVDGDVAPAYGWFADVSGVEVLPELLALNGNVRSRVARAAFRTFRTGGRRAWLNAFMTGSGPHHEAAGLSSWLPVPGERPERGTLRPRAAARGVVSDQPAAEGCPRSPLALILTLGYAPVAAPDTFRPYLALN